MPLQPNLTQRVINVQWAGGAVFVTKENYDMVTTGKIKNEKDQEWIGPFNPGIEGIRPGGYGTSGSALSSAVIGGKPVFVMLGYGNSTQSDVQNSTFFLTSNDGLTWRKTFEVSEQQRTNPEGVEEPFFAEPTGLVWKPNDPTKPTAGGTFYASLYVSAVHHRVAGALPDGQPLYANDWWDGEYIYASNDGERWSRIISTVQLRIWKAEQNGFQFGDGMRDTDPSSMPQFCTKPENRGGLPDGLQAYSKESKTFVKPTDLVKFGPVSGALYHGVLAPGRTEEDPSAFRIPSPSLTVSGDADIPTSVSGPCRAIAFYGGVWVATGGGFVDVSFGKDFETKASPIQGAAAIGCKSK